MRVVVGGGDVLLIGVVVMGSLVWSLWVMGLSLKVVVVVVMSFFVSGCSDGVWRRIWSRGCCWGLGVEEKDDDVVQMGWRGFK